MSNHMQAAIEAGMNALLETSEQEAGWLGDLVHLEPDPDGDLCIVQLNDGTSIDVQKAVAEVMGAMLPHLRAMIAQEIMDYWEACGELIDTHNGARLAFDAIAARIAKGPQQ